MSQIGFDKSSIILAGGVIEEILLHLLQSKGCSVQGKKFFELINLAKQESIFEKSIHGLLDPLRDFRNLVHIEKERKEFSADKAMAKTAISALFLIIKEINA